MEGELPPHPSNINRSKLAKIGLLKFIFSRVGRIDSTQCLSKDKWRDVPMPHEGVRPVSDCGHIVMCGDAGPQTPRQVGFSAANASILRCFTAFPTAISHPRVIFIIASAVAGSR